MERALALWRQLTLWERVGVAAVVAVVVVLFLVSTFTKGAGDQGHSLWQVLMDLGVVSGGVGLVYGLLQKYLEKKLFAEAPGQDGAVGQPDFQQSPKIKSKPGFMGLSAHQWLVTLHVVFAAGLAGAVLAGFRFGPASLAVTGFALLVVGFWMTVLSIKVGLAYRKQLRQEGTEGAAVTFELMLSGLLGVSTLVPMALGLFLAAADFPHAVTWVYFLYASAIFLPEMHVLGVIVPCMQPIRNSAALWISGGYLVGMFAVCAGIAMTAFGQTRPVHSPYAEKLVGKWTIEGGFGRGESVEFTPSGTVVHDSGGSFSHQTSGTYWFTADKTIVMQQNFGRGVTSDTTIDVDFINNDEIVVVNTSGSGFYHVNGRLRRAAPAGQEQVQGRTSAITPENRLKARRLAPRTVGFESAGRP
jgi:hypothetical protein